MATGVATTQTLRTQANMLRFLIDNLSRQLQEVENAITANQTIQSTLPSTPGGPRRVHPEVAPAAPDPGQPAPANIQDIPATPEQPIFFSSVASLLQNVSI